MTPEDPKRPNLSAGAGPTGDAAGATDPQAQALAAGTVLAGRYEVRALLGAGGMGAVYRVHDRVRATDVALKVMLPSLLAREKALERFRHEAEIMLRLSHPAIVRVFDVGEDAARGLRFFTMELLEGMSLRAWLEAKKAAREAVDPKEALEIARQLLEALRYAHAVTVHRDLKPENIFLSAGRAGFCEVKILDFGIAKLQSPSQFTATSVALGTAYYMAPEQQLDAAKVDQRADLYSLSVILYEMLTGELPVGRFRTPSEERKALPRALDEVVLRGLETKPERRTATAERLLAEVAAIRGVLETGRAPRVGARRAFITGAAIGLVVAGVALGLTRPWEKPAAPASPVVPAPERAVAEAPPQKPPAAPPVAHPPPAAAPPPPVTKVVDEPKIFFPGAEESDHNESADGEDYGQMKGDSKEFLSALQGSEGGAKGRRPGEKKGLYEAMGTGGGGRFGGRFGGRRNLVARGGGSQATESAVAAGLRWLARHQGEDGGWHADFAKRCAPEGKCAGEGERDYDVGMTSLAVLAFLGAGTTPASQQTYEDPATHRKVSAGDCVKRGLEYLVSVQDGEGCVGPRGMKYMYDHAIGTLAVAEACGLGGARAPAEKAVAFLLAAQNPGLTQKKHAVLRNFPVIGHFRYWLEAIGPEVRQYIVTNNDEERPFSRDQRRWVYASSKKENNYFGFGTDNDLELSPNYLIIKHAAFPLLDPHVGDPAHDSEYRIPCAKVLGAHRKRRRAFRPRSAINISGMSYGSLSAAAVESLNRGAVLAGCWQSTGEGGISPHHRHGGDLVWQVGTGYFGCREPDGRFSLEKFKENVARNKVVAIEIKMSQGAKPGAGGILPAAKITQEIVEIRGIPFGRDCVSPPGHSAFQGVEGLLDFAETLSEATGGLPIGIKSAVGQLDFWRDLAHLMGKDAGRGIDFVTIDGGEGGTGAGPLVFTDHVAQPFKIGFTQVYRIFAEAGLHEKIVFNGSGKLGFPEQALFAFALGCDLVAVAREAMLAIGCIQAQRCHTGHCPTGVTTNHPWLMRGLDPTYKSARAANYIVALRRELLQLSRACGVPHPALVTTGFLDIVDDLFHARSVTERFGYKPGWGLPSKADVEEIRRIMTGSPAERTPAPTPAAALA